MNKFAQLGADIAKLWLKYGNSYFGGIKNTLISIQFPIVAMTTR